MSRVKVINPPKLAPPIGFAHATEANGWIFLGGQISTDASGDVLFAGDMAAQFDQAVHNVATALISAGSLPQDVVKITYFVTDMKAYRESLKAIGDSYRSVFGKHYPAATLVEVTGLFEPEAMIEIECLARRKPSTISDRVEGT